ncbi:MAG: hypothetical protein M1826_004288 [Phylliscum demangeonii]|nr:MAG: hypothetical protein M1826_004288 [Phylliscum demangeonii]
MAQGTDALDRAAEDIRPDPRVGQCQHSDGGIPPLLPDWPMNSGLRQSRTRSQNRGVPFKRRGGGKYPGRSSQVCNGRFLVTHAARNPDDGGVGGNCYTYSVFKLVYESKVASCRIWDALGFQRIGRVKGAGNLKSHPDQLIDALIYGRDLGPDGDDYVLEERIDQIKFYLRHGEYPTSADRAQRSRLRGAAMHYKPLDDDRLLLKDKEVVSDRYPDPLTSYPHGI